MSRHDVCAGSPLNGYGDPCRCRAGGARAGGGGGRDDEGPSPAQATHPTHPTSSMGDTPGGVVSRPDVARFPCDTVHWISARSNDVNQAIPGTYIAPQNANPFWRLAGA